MAKLQGTPCWYELNTGSGGMGAAEDFYGKVFGWSFRDAGMEGFDYHLASLDDDMIAGLMSAPDLPAFWCIYFAVDDADQAAAAVEAAGGKTFHAPADIPGTGRFATLADAHGAAFGILQPEPMPGDGSGGGAGGGAGGAFDQKKPGHGNWHELMTTDPAGAFGFYADLFGWKESRAMDMGDMGTYRVFSNDGTDIGGIAGLGRSPAPAWLPYFGVGGIGAAIGRVESAGGRILGGPMEVPGGAVVAVAQDPHGAWFAMVGPQDAG